MVVVVVTLAVMGEEWRVCNESHVQTNMDNVSAKRQ